MESRRCFFNIISGGIVSAGRLRVDGQYRKCSLFQTVAMRVRNVRGVRPGRGIAAVNQ